MIYGYLLLNESQVIICDHCEIIILTGSIFLLQHYATIILNCSHKWTHVKWTNLPKPPSTTFNQSINQSINQSKLWFPMHAATYAANAASKGHKRTQIVLQESFLLEVATWDALEICCTNSHWAILTQIPMVLVFFAHAKTWAMNMSSLLTHNKFCN